MISRAYVLAAACAFFAAGALGGACAATSNDAGNVDTSTTLNQLDASDSGSESTVSVAASSISMDAGVMTAASTQGSPLCNASPANSICYPDNPATPKECDLSPDGGAYDPMQDYDGSLLGCHVVSDGSVPPAPAPACLPAGPGKDGAQCAASSECSTTEECVGAGTCRRYCCLEGCGGQAFCDIQPERQNPALIVPVCMPIQPCALLDEGDGGTCDQGETCTTFVGVNGGAQTSCVQVGPARAGDSCDSQHCAAGLICIGMWGQKRCYTPCHVDGGAECAATQICIGGLPLFPNPEIGACQSVVQDL